VPGSEHTGTNIAGKPRIFMTGVGGFGAVAFDPTSAT